MGAVTYPSEDVEHYIEAHFIPVQVNVKEQPEAMELFGASWTPSIIIQDADEREHRRLEGYFDPKRFLEELSLARLKAALDQKEYETARERANETMQYTRGDPLREPETMYWSAVADYFVSHNAEQLKHGWERLLEQFPESDWAKKAEVIKT